MIKVTNVAGLNMGIEEQLWIDPLYIVEITPNPGTGLTYFVMSTGRGCVTTLSESELLAFKGHE